MTTRDLMTALKARYAPPQYAFVSEVGNATGTNCNRHADGIAMSLWPSRGLEIEGFEVKASRNDWLKELKNPAKAESICRFCDRWWLVVGDKAIVQEGELPPTWGLLVPNGDKLKVDVQAPKLEPQPITRSFLAALLRRSTEQSVDAEAEKRFFDGGFKAGEARQAAIFKHEKDNHAKLVEKVHAFEAASGVSIQYGYWDGDKIGSAVRAVLNGDTPTKQMKALLGHAKRVVESIESCLQESESEDAA